MQDGQLIEDGKIITVDGVELECTAVSYLEVEGRRYNYSYTLRRKTEVDAERAAEEARLAAEAENQVAAEPTTEPVNQPEENKEETLNVR